ncbi:PQQ-binding-like beta-propeller repeat protein [Streptomyces sp. A7024]|uniref:PQQ-binding-like beta-propeller repeat protein n=1 Tax=Streptomyces coryli TaxID=1128680 RepID=A0A6G4U4P1_9ACTN|nr:PQQ-binding-like beta-propeller repeat protein [Streptomyces coryli]NGN67209.1 PQQ-binding-like beta-propeller repeat protein [Streptomyces coryli]
MQPLRADDPQHFGPYRPVGRLDAEGSEIPAPQVRFIAHSTGGERTVVIFADASEPAPDRALRFRAAAEQAQRLGGIPGLRMAPVTELAAPGEPRQWWASPYAPVHPLPAAVAAQGGGLPELTVCALAAALAEALGGLHATGNAFGGLTPAAVLLSGEGPVLAGFGAVGVGGPDGAPRTELAGLPAEFLPPEQAAGGRPRPLGDIYALGAVLCYAAAGRLGGGPAALPDRLRAPVERCLRTDPAERPTAEALLSELLRAAPRPQSPAHAPATVADPGSFGAAGLLAPGWLPRRVSASLAGQAMAVLAAGVDGVPDFTPVPVAGPGPETASRAAAGTVVATAGAKPSRRALIAGLAGGTAGLVAGGAGAWAVTKEDPPPGPTLAERLAEKTSARKKTPPGMAPAPRWHQSMAGSGALGPVLPGDDRTVAVVTRAGVTGLDARTGEEAWRSDGLRPRAAALPDGRGRALVAGAEPAVLDLSDGKVAWRAAKHRRGGSAPYGTLLALRGSSACFTVEDGGKHTAVAYDIESGRELWRTPLPGPAAGARLLGDVLVVLPDTGTKPAAKEPATLTALGFGDGTQMWSEELAGMAAAHWADSSSGRTLVAAAGSRLRAYDTDADAERLWELAGKKWLEEDAPFGPPCIAGGLVYALNRGRVLHAVGLRSGRLEWKQPSAVSVTEDMQVTPPRPVLARSAGAVLAADRSQVLAFEADGGKLMWRFTDTVRRPSKKPPRRLVTVVSDLALVSSGRRLYALPLT